MTIQFTCPHCNNTVSIDGIDYKLCPICGYNEKLIQKGEITLHEERIKQGQKRSIKEIVQEGLKKFRNTFKEEI